MARTILIALALIMSAFSLAPPERSSPPIVNLERAREVASAMQAQQDNWIKTVTDDEVKHRAAVARIPPMGWSSWNAFYCNIDEDKIKTNLKLMKSLGLKDLGYDLINIDDCWNLANRTNNKLQPDPTKFPDMKNFSAYVHSNGFKFGLYTSQTSQTCMGRAAAYEHEAIDTQTYCDWNVDYLKIDLCGGDHYSHLNESWIKFRKAFDECETKRGSPIVMSVEYCGINHPDYGHAASYDNDTLVERGAFASELGGDPVTGCGEWIPGKSKCITPSA
jgi:hypothetical protein